MFRLIHVPTRPTQSLSERHQPPMFQCYYDVATQRHQPPTYHAIQPPTHRRRHQLRRHRRHRRHQRYDATTMFTYAIHVPSPPSMFRRDARHRCYATIVSTLTSRHQLRHQRRRHHPLRRHHPTPPLRLATTNATPNDQPPATESIHVPSIHATTYRSTTPPTLRRNVPFIDATTIHVQRRHDPATTPHQRRRHQTPPRPLTNASPPRRTPTSATTLRRLNASPSTNVASNATTPTNAHRRSPPPTPPPPTPPSMSTTAATSHADATTQRPTASTIDATADYPPTTTLPTIHATNATATNATNTTTIRSFINATTTTTTPPTTPPIIDMLPPTTPSMFTDYENSRLLRRPRRRRRRHQLTTTTIDATMLDASTVDQPTTPPPPSSRPATTTSDQRHDAATDVRRHLPRRHRRSTNAPRRRCRHAARRHRCYATHQPPTLRRDQCSQRYDATNYAATFHERRHRRHRPTHSLIQDHQSPTPPTTPSDATLTNHQPLRRRHQRRHRLLLLLLLLLHRLLHTIQRLHVATNVQLRHHLPPTTRRGSTGLGLDRSGLRRLRGSP